MKRPLHKFPILILVFLLITSSSFPLFVLFAPAKAQDNWLAGWSYRKRVTISSATDAGTGYQIKMILHYGSGADNPATGDIYLDGKCRADFGDIRFTTSEGTEIYYWLRRFVAGDWAEFWVRIPGNLSESSQTIYVYYGNPEAETTSNQMMTGIVQLREYKWYADYNPDITFIQNPDSLQIEAATTALGRGIALIIANRTWLNGKYLRLNWQGITISDDNFLAYLQVWDGAYECSSSSDFPGGGPWATKGAGQLYSKYSISTFSETLDIQLDLSAGTEDYCTIFIFVHDQSKSLACRLFVYWLEINTGPGGSGNLWRHEFNTSMVMEQTGTIGDYGLLRKYVSPEPSIAEIGPEQTPGVSIGDLEAPATVTVDTYFLLNATIVANNSVSEFTNASVEIENGIILLWEAATDMFSEYQDANGYCTLDAAGSFKTQLNSTAYKLSWRIKLSSDFPTGHVDIIAADVYSTIGHATDSELDLFYFSAFSAYTGWWDVNWQKRKRITVTENSGSALTDYQIALNVTYDADMQADFDDLRFTWLNETSNSEVLCDAWLETKSDGAWAYVWVEVPEIPASDSAILFMYYGNETASPYWDGEATFIFWDDFTDLSKWTVAVGATPPISSEQAYTGTTSVKIDANSLGTIKLTHSFGGSLTNVAVEGRHYDDTSIVDQADAFTVYDGSNLIRIGNDNDYTNIAYYDTAFRETSVPRQTGWNHIKICITSSGADGYYRGIQIFTDNPTITQIDSIALAAWDSTYHSVVYYDTILVRKYADPEPSISVGEEETSAQQNLIVTGCYFSTGQQITVKGYVYYEGTTTPPSESVTIYVEYGGSVKASTSSLTNGLFTLSWTESTAGLRTYTIYAVADGRVSVQNQTVQAFSFFVDSQFRWGFSNDTIASFSWDDTQKRLNVTFSSPASSKLYIYGRPTYILGETFDLGTDYSAGWTQLDLNQTTSVVSAHPNWGDFYVRKLTAGEVTDAYWTDQVFTLVLNGTSGASATLEIYCGSRGMPKSWSGFTGEPSYDADTTILSGTVTYQSPVTVTLDYTMPTSSGSSAAGGGGSSSAGGFSILPAVTLSIAPVQFIQMHPGETVTGMLSINFTGVNNIRVLSLEFSGAAADWITLAEPLPKTIFKPIGEEVGTGEIELRIIAPENAEPGDYTVPVVVKAEAVGSQIQVNGYVTFSIIPQAPSVSLVPEYMTWIFAAALAGLILYAYLKD